MTTPTVEDFLSQPRVRHTLRLVPESQRELFVAEMSDHITTHGQSRFEEGVKAERERVKEWAKRKGERIAYRIDSYEHGVATTCKDIIFHLTTQSEDNHKEV